MLEAAALKAMIITTATGGSPQLVVDGDHGTIIPSMESADIVVALREALANPQHIALCAENAYANLVAHFTWEQVAEDFLNIYHNNR